MRNGDLMRMSMDYKKAAACRTAKVADSRQHLEMD